MVWFILLLALLLRLINLNQSFWLDEGTQATIATQPLSLIWFGRSADFHPPLSYILAHFWMVGGKGEVWLRLLPVGFGVASVAVLYYLARNFFNEKIAIIASFFFAIAPYHIYYSQEFRMYSLATFFATASMFCFVKYLTHNKRRWGVGYALSTTLLLYTHYLGILLFIVQGVWLLYKKQLRSFLSLYFFIFLFYLPWLPQFFNQLKGGLSAEDYLPGWSTVLSLPLVKALPLTFIKFSIGRIDFDNTMLYAVIAAIVFLFYGFIFLLALKHFLGNKNVQLASLWLVLPILLAIIISGIIPLNQPFRLLFVLPAFYLLLAVGVGSAARWLRPLILGVTIVSLAGVTLYHTQPRFWREDWRGAVSYIHNQYIQSQSLVSSAVLFEFPDPFAPYLWYDQGETPAIGMVKKFPAQKESVTSELNNVMEGKETAYLFQYLQPLTDPEHEVENWLQSSGFNHVATKDIRGVGFIYTYKR